MLTLTVLPALSRTSPYSRHPSRHPSLSRALPLSPSLGLSPSLQIEFLVKDGAPLETVVAASSAKEAWDLLSERYNGVGNARVGHLMTQVYNTRFSLSRFASLLLLYRPSATHKAPGQLGGLPVCL